MQITTLLSAGTTKIIAIAICLSAFSAYAQTATLTGHIEGIGEQPIIFWYDVGGKQKKDTVYAANDRFTYQPRPSDDGQISLYIKSPRFTSFWYEPGAMTVTGDAKAPYKLTFKGGTENEVLNQYNESIGWKKLNDKRKKKETFQFIKDHATSRTAADLLFRYSSMASEDDAVYRQLYNELSPDLQESYFGRKAAKQIEILRNQPIVGRAAPNFTVPDTAGVNVSLSDFKEKYVLLDFWGHWCAPCIKSFPKVKALHEKYGDKLAIVGMAMEFPNDRDKWLAAIRKHKAYWTQLSELNGDDGVHSQYNITGYPTYMLLDKEGVVLERSLDLETIEKKLEKLSIL